MKNTEMKILKKYFPFVSKILILEAKRRLKIDSKPFLDFNQKLDEYFIRFDFDSHLQDFEPSMTSYKVVKIKNRFYSKNK